METDSFVQKYAFKNQLLVKKIFYALKSQYIWDLIFTHFPRIITNVFLQSQGLSLKYIGKKLHLFSKIP